MEPEHYEQYADKQITVPDYGSALKTLFGDKQMNILLHVTRLPCDFDPELTARAPSPATILQQNLFKPHPQGKGTIYYKNYPMTDSEAEQKRTNDADNLGALGLFSFKHTTTSSNLSLLAQIKTDTNMRQSK